MSGKLLIYPITTFTHEHIPGCFLLHLEYHEHDYFVNQVIAIHQLLVYYQIGMGIIKSVIGRITTKIFLLIFTSIYNCTHFKLSDARVLSGLYTYLFGWFLF
jgi:hypothetical protein